MRGGVFGVIENAYMITNPNDLLVQLILLEESRAWKGWGEVRWR